MSDQDHSAGKHLRFSLPEGGAVMFVWPGNISIESLEMVEEVLAIQLNSIRKAIAKKKALQPSTQEVSTVQPDPIDSPTRPRLIPDVECKQGKCACTTTGCWGKCSLVISQNQEVSK